MRAVNVRQFLLDQGPFLLGIPAFLWQLYFLVVPLLFIIVISLVTDMSVGDWSLTLEHYLALFSSMQLKVTLNSAVLACITGVLCLLIGYPVAYYLALKSRRLKQVLLVFLILPSWTSFIIQVYSWFYLLQKRGLFSSFFYALGWTGEPISLLNNYSATVLGMVYCYLPFMVLPLYTVLEKMDKRLLEAAADLGASPWRTFTTIVWPLSMSGIRVGLALVMVPAFGEFAIPDLMGGVKDLYLGRIIFEKFILFRDWHSGAAVVMVSFLIPIAIAVVWYAVHRVQRRLMIEE
ncbi:MAG: spermidine/putrescine transport system permease protein [Candidatus Dependentiae bacterium]|nr:spermidine/putrescine transport system permease protein [Candidatus Dependentiae bacterium]